MNDADAASSIQARPSRSAGDAPSRVPRQQRSSSLDDYEIIREIGRGGTAIVYEAYHKSLRRKVALKKLPAAATLDPRWHERFHNEVRATCQLSHPNIVPFYELGQDGSHFYTMQLIDGISLAEVIRRLRQCRNGNRPCVNQEAECVHPAFLRLCERCRCRFARSDVATKPNETTTDLSASPDYHRVVVELIRDAALAVHYAHDQGILHLDIKPSNILIDGDGVVWVTDFGAARISDATVSESLSGTLCYASPEQVYGRNDQVGARSDVYSLGATLYGLLTLERSFADVSPNSAAVNRAMPRELAAVINKAMARDPEERYATASHLADDLQDGIRAAEECSPKSRVRSGTTFSRRLWSLMVAFAASAVIAALFVLGHKTEPKINVVQRGLIGFWAAEGDARDSSGHGHHGTTHNGVSFVPGVQGSAFCFDGVDDWISTDHSFPDDQSHSISAWMKWEGQHGGGNQEAVSWWDSDDTIPNRIFLGTTKPSAGHAGVRYGDDWVNVGIRIPLARWVHIAATYDAKANERRIYLNGVLVGVKNHTHEARFSASMAIGRQGDFAGEYWHGLIDELALYDRALSADEVLFNARPDNQQ